MMITTEQKIRELADALCEVADFSSLTREDALRIFTREFTALTRHDREGETS